MEKQNITVLLATRSTLLRDGLVALLTAIPQIDKVEIAESLETTLSRMEAKKPQLVVIDSMLLGSTLETTLDEIHIFSPATQRMIILRDMDQLKRVSYRAEAFLTIGSSPSTIVDTITSLLNSERDDDDWLTQKE